MTEAYFEIEEMYFAQNKQWVIKKLNQSTITDLNVFEESSKSLTRKSVQMNTLAQYMAKSFQETAEKASISFQSGETFHYSSVYIYILKHLTFSI